MRLYGPRTALVAGVLAVATSAAAGCTATHGSAIAPGSSPATLPTSQEPPTPATPATPSGRIVFSDDPGAPRHHQLYLERADGTHVHRLVVSSYDDVQPTISPDGRQVVFIRKRAHGRLPDETFVVGIDGRGLHRINFGGCPARCGDAVEGHAWSPDGRHLVFARAVFTSPGSLLEVPPDRVELWVARANGSHARRLTREHGTAQDDQASWSPDGSHLVFLHWTYGGPDRFRIATVRSDGSGMAMLTPIGLDSADPSYSPDGQVVLFQSPPDPGGGDQVLYTVTPDGRALTALTANLGGPATFHGSWSPDGRQVLFSHAVGRANADLWLVGRDGSDPHPLTETPDLNENDAFWGASPD